VVDTLGGWCTAKPPLDSVFADHRIIILIPMVVLAGRARYSGVGLLAIMLWPALEGVLALLAVQWRSVYSLWWVEKVLL
jgi:hypothetical protein